MLAAIDIYMVVIAVITYPLGLALNSYVIMAYFIDWRKKQCFSVSDKIFISMAFMNIFLQCMMVTNGLLYCLWINLIFINKGYLYIFIFQFYLIYGNLWHTAWLSVYYCLKLVNWADDFFHHLKKRLSSFIVNLLLTTLVGLFINNVPFIWTLNIEIPQNGTIRPFSSHYGFTLNYQFIVFNMVIGSCVPFLVTFICIGCSVWSLLGHVSKIKQNASLYSSCPQVNALVRASKTMIVQVLLNSLMYFAVITMWLSSFNLGNFWKASLWTLVMAYPSAQIVTLILGNTRLYSRLFGQKISS